MSPRVESLLLRIDRRLESLERRVEANHQEIVRRTLFLAMPEPLPMGPLPTKRRSPLPKKRRR